jgi:preprotein translocase subunit SecG
LLVWLYIPLVFVHVIVAVALILIVLLQAGKGAELGAAFGGASQTVFGPRGPGSFLGKLTAAAACIFMVTSLALAIFSTQHLGGSVVLTSPAPKPATGPAATPSEPPAPGASSTPTGAGTTETNPAHSGGTEAPQEQK